MLRGPQQCRPGTATKATPRRSSGDLGLSLAAAAADTLNIGRDNT
jgi:hypothetical protein